MNSICDECKLINSAVTVDESDSDSDDEMEMELDYLLRMARDPDIDFGSSRPSGRVIQSDEAVVRRNIALIIAVCIEHANCAQLLINDGAEVNAVEFRFTELNRRQIYKAAQHEIQWPATGKGHSAWSLPLVYAAANGSGQCVAALINAGADVNKLVGDRPPQRRSPWLSFETLNHLISEPAGAEVTKRVVWGETALNMAARFGHLNCVSALIAAGADVNLRKKDEMTILGHAVLSKKLKCVKMLIEAGANVNEAYSEDSAGEFSYQVGCGDFDEDLVDAKSCKIMVTPIITAACLAWKKLTELLRESGACVNEGVVHGQSVATNALHRAVSKVTATKILIEAGAFVNATDDFLRTPLMLHVCLGRRRDHEKHLAYMKCLMQAGADVNMVNKDGRSALVLSGIINYSTTQFLLQSGADVNLLDKHGRSTLLFPDSCYHLQITELLLNAGADVSIVANNGKAGNRGMPTAVFSAVNCGGLTQARLFLELGAPINYCDYLGRNALEFAIIRKSSRNRLPNPRDDNHELIDTLLAAGESTSRTKLPIVSRYHGRESDVPQNLHLQAVDRDQSLMSLCRKAIRKHLINLDPHSNLFVRIPRLGLPSLINTYLLFGRLAEEEDTLIRKIKANIQKNRR